MSFLFPKEKAAPVAAAAPPPSRSSADVQAAAMDERRRLANQRGRASTILTGGSGLGGNDTQGGDVARKMLLGA